MDHLEILAQVPLFAPMKKRELKEHRLKPPRNCLYEPGEMVIKEGERDGRLFVLLDGEVEVIKGLGQPGERLLRRLGPGAYFGEMAVLGDAVRTASVRGHGPGPAAQPPGLRPAPGHGAPPLHRHRAFAGDEPAHAADGAAHAGGPGRPGAHLRQLQEHPSAGRLLGGGGALRCRSTRTPISPTASARSAKSASIPTWVNRPFGTGSIKEHGTMKMTTRFKELVLAPEILILPVAPDALCARIARQVGFKALTSGGYSNSAHLLGKPDVNLLTVTEMAEAAGRIADASGLPVMADGDTGHGNVVNVMRTVRLHEKAGAAALFLGRPGFAQALRPHVRQAHHPHPGHGGQAGGRPGRPPRPGLHDNGPHRRHRGGGLRGGPGAGPALHRGGGGHDLRGGSRRTWSRCAASPPRCRPPPWPT